MAFQSHFREELLRTRAAYLQHSVWEESRKITTGSVEQLGLSTWDEVSATQNQLFMRFTEQNPSSTGLF